MVTRRRHGYSLIELLIVVGLLGLITAVITPALFNDDEAIIERAAAQIATAIRFAQNEAIRTQQTHGVSASTASQSVKVFRLNETVNPAVLVYDVYNPLDKQLYEFRFDTASDPNISDSTFNFAAGPSLERIEFSGTHGIPRHNDGGAIRLLNSSNFQLTLSSFSRVIAVSPITGRVTIQ